jgi:hypothetical protein
VQTSERTFINHFCCACFFHQEVLPNSCEWGLEGLRNYCVDWDEKLKVSKNQPRHDWASHAADAFGYMALGWKQVVGPEPPPTPKPLFKPLHTCTYDEYADEFLDEVEINVNGQKVIQATKRPKRPERI